MNGKRAVVLFIGGVFLALSATMQPQFAVVWVAATMVLWWMTEVLPLSVTALLPMLLFPLLGILDGSAVSKSYAHPLVFLFFGGFLLAQTMEKWGLHRRIALFILCRTGSSLRRVVFGFMLATALLSMWLSNTATAVMMLPIALSVLRLVDENYPEAVQRQTAAALLLGLAYAANIGGMATLIGTPPNLVFAAYVSDHNLPLPSFAEWLTWGVPLAALLLLATYWLLVRVLYKLPGDKLPTVHALFITRYQELGALTAGEKRIAWVFGVTALAWVVRPLLVEATGWTGITDTTIALLGGLICFAIPVGKASLLGWEDTSKLPWGILLLFGGGLALAAALETNGWIETLTGLLKSSGSWNLLSGTVLLTAIGIYLTEFMSNLALVAVMMPLVDAFAQATNLNFLPLALGLTLGASCAFMLPMATPPNAVVFASGKLRVWEMVRAGFWLNLISLLLVVGVVALLV